MILSDIFLTGSLQRKPSVQSISDMSHKPNDMSIWRQALALDAMIPFFLVLGECLLIGVHYLLLLLLLLLF